MAFAKRKSLRDELDRIEMVEGDEALELRINLIDELEQDLDASKDFRWHAPKSQNRQDFHLEMYRTFVFRVLKGIKDEEQNRMSEDEKTLLLFPDNEATLCHQMSLYVLKQKRRDSHGTD